MFLQPIARLLVVVHALCALALVGAATHQLVVAIGIARGRLRLGLARVYGVVFAIAYVTTLSLGALAYPTYRYRVRALYFDRYAPWASNLFDLKENFAAIGLPLALALWMASRVVDGRDRAVAISYVVLASLAAAIVWFDVVSGLLVTLERGV